MTKKHDAPEEKAAAPDAEKRVAALREELAKAEDDLREATKAHFPKHVYKGTQQKYETKTVNSAEEQKALGKGWAETPADLPEEKEK